MTDVIDMKRRPAKLPAKAEPSFKEFDEFTKWADWLCEKFVRLRKAFDAVRATSETSVPAALKMTTQAVGEPWRGHDLPLHLVKKCKEYLERYPDPELSEHECERYQRVETTKKIALLLGSFPNTGSVPDPKIYSRMLVEEILAISPLLEAVESTCRKIRQDATFVPSIGEFMKVLKVENDLWQDRFTAIYSPIYMLFGSYRDDLEELARRGITTARNGLGDLPDDVRVRHWKHGSGAVVSSSRSQVGVIFDGEDDDESLWIPRALLELEFALEHEPVETLVIGAKVPVSVGGDGNEF